MSEKPVLVPGPDHPITIAATGSSVVARLGDRVLAESEATLTLREASYPPVLYFPRSDVDMGVLERTDTETYCPYKGECHYFGIRADEGLVPDAVWTYETPYPAVAEIREYVAFYPDKVSIVAD